MRPLINTVPSHEVLVRKVQSGEVDAPATIDPAASNTTSVSTTVPSLLTSLIGTLALLYDTFPKTLYEEIHAGDDAQNPYEDIAFSSMVLRMLRKFLDIFWGTGASNDPDGLGKWLSATANKWGLNTTTSANYWFRSHAFTDLSAAFSLELLREFHRVASNGELVDDSDVTQYGHGNPKVGFVDTKSFATMQKWFQDKQTIELANMTEVNKIGIFAKRGLRVDEVVYFPDVSLDRLMAANSTLREVRVLNPDDFEIMFLKGYGFDFLDSKPNEDMSKNRFSIPMQKLSGVVWGEYAVLASIYNIFCYNPRGNVAWSPSS